MRRSDVEEALAKFDQLGDDNQITVPSLRKFPPMEAARRWVNPDIEAAAKARAEQDGYEWHSFSGPNKDAWKIATATLIEAALGYEEE